LDHLHILTSQGFLANAVLEKISNMHQQKTKMIVTSVNAKSKFLLLLLVTVTMLFGSCRKESRYDPTKEVKRHFFKNSHEASRVVQQSLDKIRPGEKLEVIESISYLHSKTHSYAFVFYKSNNGNNNLVIQKDFSENEELVGGTITSCEGSACTCRVRGTIGRDGSVSLECTCPSTCSMVITP
jgi:hypothetical protein